MRRVFNCVQVVRGWVAGLLLLAQVSAALGQVAVPVVKLEVRDGTAMEQSPFIDSIPDTAEVAFVRSGDLTKPLTVYLMTGGTAVAGEDYAVIGPEVVIPAGEAELAMVIAALDDDIPERDESLVISIIIPPGLPGEPPIYRVGVPGEGRIVIRDDDGGVGNLAPEVRLLTPPDGSVLAASRPLLIVASARDPDGEVAGVEFFMDGESIGRAVMPVEADPVVLDDLYPEFGLTHPFRLVWEDPVPGEHVIVAVATDNEGLEARSEPVQVTLLDAPTIPVVTVEATDPEGAEVGPDADGVIRRNPAVFTLRREGLTEDSLVVRYRLIGAAQNGVDYALLPYEAEFAAGEDEVRVVVQPIDDDLAEPTEGVVLALVVPEAVEVWPPRGDFYFVGWPAQARAWILDDDEAPNLPPVVRLMHPQDGEVFREGAMIQLAAWAGDRDGEVVSVQFYAGERLIGEGMPDPRFPQVYRMVLGPVIPGTYGIHAMAVDDQGAEQSSRIARVEVLAVDRPPVVTVETIDGEGREVPTDAAMPADPLVFRVHRTGSTEGELTVFYGMRGTAQNGIDYRELPLVVTIRAGASWADVEVVPLPDELAEGPEGVVMVLRSVPSLEPGDPVLGLGDVRLPYVVGVPGMARGVIVDDELEINRPPRVAITDPENGFLFLQGQSIGVRIVARDDDGWVGSMALYVGDRLLGEQVIDFVQPPEPGQEQVFEFQWEGAQVGAHSLRARATDNRGVQSWSGAVRVGVVEDSGRTVVGIIAADALAVEPGPDGEGDPATFAVCRRGDLSIPLTVYYQVGGTAENGVDYELLSGEVVIPEGQWGVRLRVLPLADDLAEATESVVVKLVDPVCIELDPPPPECYRVGHFAAAEARLMDSTPVENMPPKVELLRPHEGDVFHAPADIKLVAAAGDRDGRVVQVAFYGDGELLHEWVADDTVDRQWSDQECCAFTFVWDGVKDGVHEVVVVATDDDGASTRSRVVSVQVVGVFEPPVVRIVATDPRAVERDDATLSRSARFRVWRTGDLAGALTVWYSVRGTATPGSDYVELAGSVVIPEGRKSAGIELVPLPDDEVEPVETVLLGLEPSPLMGPVESYRIGHPAKAMAVIVDAGEGPCEVRSLPGLGFELGVRGERGMPYRIEASDDMVHWVPVADVLGDEDGRVRFVDPERRLDGPRFYRTRPSVVEAVDAMEE